MRPKHKMTGCARFFIFFIIFVPLVFFGAAYFRGENGLQILKDTWRDLFGGSAPRESSSGRTESVDNETLEVCEQQLKDAQERIRELEAELAREKVK